MDICYRIRARRARSVNEFRLSEYMVTVLCVCGLEVIRARVCGAKSGQEREDEHDPGRTRTHFCVLVVLCIPPSLPGPLSHPDAGVGCRARLSRIPRIIDATGPGQLHALVLAAAFTGAQPVKASTVSEPLRYSMQDAGRRTHARAAERAHWHAGETHCAASRSRRPLDCAS